MMRKVAALLAKAEATPFGEEAEALIAKAQELMMRYSITEAMLAKAGSSNDNAKVIRGNIEVVAPYTEAKSGLAFAIMRANKCEGVYWGSAARRMIDFVGYSHDVDATKRMYASLEIQMATAAAQAVRFKPSNEHGKTFTNSFMTAFGSRIGQRLKEVNSSVEAEIQSETTTSVALVLADKSAIVKQAHDVYWPKTRTKTVSTRRSEAGISAGISAANSADIGRNLGTTNKGALN